MSFNNGQYIFSDVPGYEASKGERIVRAFQKLWAKINHLEQAKILEKSTCSQEVQSSSHTDLTLSDIRYEILLTQLRYLIKIVREYANDKSTNKDCHESTANSNEGSSANNNFKPMSENPIAQTEDEIDNLPYPSVSHIPSRTIHQDERERSVNDHQISTTGTQTSDKVIASDSKEKLPQDPTKQDLHSHYHLKLNDVPFILGASATASHSVVANVQNIIALMKSHNKALCAAKPQIPKDANSVKMHKTDTQDANKMIRQLSEDLSELAMKQERLKAMLDNANANPHSSEAKVQDTQYLNTRYKKCEIPNTCAKQSGSIAGFQSNYQQPLKRKPGANFRNPDKHVVPTVRIQTNENPQLARRKMLRSLKDLKTHLSEEDLSWK